MGIFAFLFRTPLGIVISAFSGVIGLVVVLVVVVGVLAFTGGPAPCTPGGGAITVSESAVTSRANRYIDDRGGDVSDVRVCIHDGYGEVTGSVDAFLASG